MTGLSKKYREEWEIKTFLKLFNREKKEDYSILRKISEDEASGPDYQIKNSKGSIFGVELCQLYDHPSPITGQQRHLQDYFEKLLEDEFCGTKGISVDYITEHLPKNEKKVKCLAREAAEKIRELIRKKKKETFELKEVTFRFRVEPDRDHNCIGRLYSLKGAYGKQNKLNTDKYYSALEKLIKDKICKSKNYIKDNPIILAIYDNTDESIFIDDQLFKDGMSEKMMGCKEYFYEIWLFNDPDTFDGRVYGIELISLE